MSAGGFGPPDAGPRRGSGPRGPYGTNEGDTWLAGDDNPIQKMLDRDGLTMIFEVLPRDGRLQECVYVTDNPELIEAARAGTELYWEQKAREN